MTDTPTNDLQQLRAALDDVDRRLLQLAAERQTVVTRIAAAKSAGAEEHPLFDRDRERAVYTRAEAVAAEVGLSPRVARQLLSIVVEHSHEVQQEASVAARATDEPRRILIVGGEGRMGRRLGSALREAGHTLDVLERGDGRDRAEAVAAADVVIVSVPMRFVEEVIDEVGPHLRDDALICDINSLKEGPCARMAALGRGEAVGLHPMFGPTVHVLRRQKVVVCPVREGPRTAWLRRELARMGMELIESDPLAHDRMMAIVQVLTHFSTLVMGEALRSTGVSLADSLRYTSPIYRLELAFVGRLFAQAPELYAEIEMTNPHGATARRSFLQAATRLDDVIRVGDRKAFCAIFDEVNRYFAEFGEDAMALSDHIIDSIVVRP